MHKFNLKNNLFQRIIQNNFQLFFGIYWTHVDLQFTSQQIL